MGYYSKNKLKNEASRGFVKHIVSLRQFKSKVSFENHKGPLESIIQVYKSWRLDLKTLIWWNIVFEIEAKGKWIYINQTTIKFLCLHFCILPLFFIVIIYICFLHSYL